MDEEFTTYASAQVMISNLTYAGAERLAEELSDIEGVSEVVFDGTEDH